MKLKVRVIPGASGSRVVGWLGDALKVRVAAPPEKGKANSAVLRLLASELNVAESDLALVSGASSQNKVVEIAGVTLEYLQGVFPAGD